MHTNQIGANARVRRSDEADTKLVRLFESSGAADSGCSLIAIGGYGRRQLAPGSDLDILLLHPKKTDVEEITQSMLYPLWDSQTKVDYSVRTIDQCGAMAESDVRVMLGLLDGRLVAGDELMADELREQSLSQWRNQAHIQLAELFESLPQRIERSGELSYLLEPDLKESFGGLRDAVVLRAIDASWIVDSQSGSTKPSVDHLLNVRDALHVSSGRHSDVLSHQEQESVAEALGFDTSDALLRSVLSAGRSISWKYDQARYAFEKIERSKWWQLKRAMSKSNKPGTRLPLANGVVMQDGEAVLARGVIPWHEPGLTLRVAAAAAQAGIRIAPSTASVLAKDSPPMAQPWTTADRESFVGLVGAGQAALPVWEVLDQVGIIAKLFPEWEALRSTPQHDPIHIYTVDRHSIQTAINASKMVREVARPDLLLIGALFHDIGKGRRSEREPHVRIDHCEGGVPFMREIATRMGFNAGDVALLESMVRLHLLLPQVATTRDLSDPTTIEYVADLVDDVELLELLRSLTQADSLAAGPGVWTRWKESLVDELVAKVKEKLVGDGHMLPEEIDLGIDDDRVGLVVQSDDSADFPTMSFASDDRTGLFADIAGVLTANRLEVLAVEAQTVGDRAMSRWVLNPEFGEVPDVTRICEDLRLQSKGAIDLDSRLDRRAKSYRERMKRDPLPPKVNIVNPNNGISTVIEVRANNIPGLLSVVARVLTAGGLEIRSVRASTLGNNAVDTFYVTHRGSPLSTERLAKVCQAVYARIGKL